MLFYRHAPLPGLRNSHRIVWTLALIVVVVLANVRPATVEAQPTGVARANAPFSLTATGEAPLHKVFAPSGLLDVSIPGITLWHDYGTFALYKVSDAALASLAADTRRQLEIDPSIDTILFDGHPVYTPAGQVDLPAGLVVKETAGPALQLVQFVGPIQQTWLDAITAAGSTPIQYVANNAYLVWADAAARQELDALAADGDFVQYHAPYQPAFKLGPSVEQRILTGTDPNEIVPVDIQMYDHPGKKATQDRIASLAVTTETGWWPILSFENSSLSLRAGDLWTVAQLPDVVWIDERFTRELMDEVQGQILAGHFDGTQSGPSSPGYQAWLDGLGFSQNPADYPVVSVADDGVGDGTITNGAGDVTFTRLGDGVTTRLTFVANCTTNANGGGVGGHGHINTSIVGGYDLRAGFPFRDSLGYQRGQGINPYGRMAQTKIFANSGSYSITNCGGNDAGVIKRQQDNGAQISTNSWGCAGCAGTYDASSQAYDVGVRDADTTEPGNQAMIIVFSAGNSGSGASTIGTPGNGKNMITVGASENKRPSDEGGSWTDGCAIGPTGADNAMDVIGFSSRGPAPGNRVKPELIAPGTHVQGTASTNAGYTGNSVCDQYRPPGQTVFAASSGTSHSTPAVAGITSLAYRWLQTHFSLTPSPAMMKSYLIAHPTYLTGVSANDTLPSNSQGYGMPNLTAAFDNTPRALVDQSVILDNTGESYTWQGAVVDPTKPLRIVMAYTDAPGAIGTSPQVNNLNLTAVVNGTTYLGNRFSGRWSTTGGTADNNNNYEAIFLPAGTTGALAITITGANIAGNGIPNVGDGTDQDFALVCYNCAQNPDYTLAVNPTSQAICAPANAAFTVDVGSVLGYATPVTLSASGHPAGTTAGFSANPVTPPGTSTLTIGNTGAAAPGSYAISIDGNAAGNLHSIAAALDVYNAAPAGPGLTAPANGATNVAVLPTFTWNAPAQAATYRIEVATDAGFSNIVASANGLTSPTWVSNVTLNTSTTYFWRVRASNTCGDGGYSAVFNFSTIAAPGDCGPGTTPSMLYQYGFEAGASGWTHSAAAGADTWAIVTANPHSGTSHFRGLDPAAISDQRLVSPPVVLPSGQNPVVFKFWHLPNLENSGTTACYDGGILEATTNGGTTWTQVPGANLLAGGYTGPVSSSFGNPLAGLSAWCNGSAYFNTIADVSAYAGQTAQFRLRLGSDSSVSDTGWDVDDVTVQSCQPACPYDVNGSGGVDIIDIQMVAGAFGTNVPAYDFDHDGSVDIDDIVAVAQYWLQPCP